MSDSLMSQIIKVGNINIKSQIISEGFFQSEIEERNEVSNEASQIGDKPKNLYTRLMNYSFLAGSSR